MWEPGSYVRLKKHPDIPKSEWGARGKIVRNAATMDDTIRIIIVKWDEANIVGSFVAADFLDPSDIYTLDFGVLGVFSKEKKSD